MNGRGIADPSGRLPWASPTPPAVAHDIRAAREHGIVDSLAERRYQRIRRLSCHLCHR